MRCLLWISDDRHPLPAMCSVAPRTGWASGEIRQSMRPGWCPCAIAGNDSIVTECI